MVGLKLVVSNSEPIPEPTALELFAQKRYQLANLQTEIDAIKPDAEIMALQVQSDKPDQNQKNRTVYSGEWGNLILQLRNQLPDKQSPEAKTLVRLEEELEAEKAHLVKTQQAKIQKYNTEIDALKAQIMELEAARDDLMVSDRTIELETQIQEQQELLTTQKPVLNYYLPKGK